MYVFTSARDVDGQLLDVPHDRWVSWSRKKNISVFYCSGKGWRKIFSIFREVLTTESRTLWLQSFFDFQFSVLPQIVSLLSGKSVIISPRGELMAGALSLKSKRKNTFISIIRPFYFFSRPKLHLTSKEEYDQLPDWLQNIPSKIFPNYCRKPLSLTDLPTKNLTDTAFTNIVFIARLVPKKGVEIAIDVMAKLDKKFVLDVYGDFEDDKFKRLIIDKIHSLGLTNRVRLNGFVPFEDCSETISKSLALILPTKGENFGHSIYDCLSVGTPVVISDQTPWRSSMSIKVCDLTKPIEFVGAIMQIQTLDNLNTRQDALQNASEYYGKLPPAKKFFAEILS